VVQYIPTTGIAPYLYIREQVKNQKRILVAPLDWGLGHATRCIPVIRELLEHGEDVVIGADGRIAELLKKEFPALEIIPLAGYRVNYSASLPMWLGMLVQAPRILLHIFAEHRQLKKMIREHRIDGVISDNRYGLWNKNIDAVLITHQLFIQCPPALRFLEPVLRFINHALIRKFNHCWIPDDERNLAGELSLQQPMPQHAQFIGLLSRWKKNAKPGEVKKYEVMAIISGPEPHRTLFENLLVDEMKKSGRPSIVVRGKPEEQSDLQFSNVRIISHLDNEHLYHAIQDSGMVICRSGYSGIMDLVTIRRDAILVPTPGQTEQEYLANYLREKKIFYSENQKDFQLERALLLCHNYSVINFLGSSTRPLSAIADWAKKIRARS